MNNGDNEHIPYSTPLTSALSHHRGSSAYLNPFAKIVRDAQTSSPRPTGRLTEGIPRKDRQSYENSLQTPQRQHRLLQTPKRDKGSTLAPYINLLRGSGANVTPVHQSQLRSHEFQQPTTPQQPSSSPPPIQDQWAEGEVTSAVPSQDKPGLLDSSVSDDNAFEELKGAHETVAEQNKQIQALRYQIITLKNARSTIVREHAQMSRELETMRAKMGENSARIGSLQSQLERSAAATNAKVQELTKMGDVVRVKEEENLHFVERLEQASKEAETVRAAYNQEVVKGEGLTAKVVDANRRIQELVKAYGTLEKNLQELGDSYNAYRRATDDALNDVKQVKILASATANEISKHDTGKLLRDARITLIEVKDELYESQRVNDFYRDKLHVTTTQLAEVTTRVRELETEKGDVWGRTVQCASDNAKLREALVASEERTFESVTRIRSLEEHGIALLAQSAELEAKMNQVEKRSEEMNTELLILRPLQQEKLQLQMEVADLTRRLSEETTSRTKLQDRVVEAKDALISAEKEAFMLRTQMQDVVNSRIEATSELSDLKIAFKELEANLLSVREGARAHEKEIQSQHDFRLFELQETINKQKHDAIALQAKYEFSEDQREHLRTSLLQEQATLARLQQELKETSIRGLIAAGQVDMHEAKIINLMKEISGKDEQLCLLNAKVMSAQDRHETQASTLRLTKEELGDMYEKLEIANKNNQAAEFALRTEIAVLNEQKTTLSAEVDSMRSDRKAQEEISLKRMNELQGVIQGLQKGLSDAKADHETAMRRETANWKERQEGYRSEVQELRGAIEQLKARRNEEATKANSAGEKAVLELEGRVEALVNEKEEMLERHRTFRERYQAGTLSDIEKDFVSSMLQDAEDLHEQAAVAKDNEIKRRDATISGLQARIAELESSLVLAYHPTEFVPDLSTILNLKVSPIPMGPTVQQPAPAPISGPPQPIDATMASVPADLIQEDNLIPMASQMPSELSTPPQSPLQSKAKGTVISFVHLSRHDSEVENDLPQPRAKATVKRMSENVPVPEGVPSKKRLRTTAGKRGNQENNTSQAPEPTGRGRQKRKKVIT